MSKIFEVIRPKSIDDPIYEDLEYLIRWIGRDGAEYWYMFFNAQFEYSTSGEIINREDEDLIQSLIDRNTRAVTLQADDISLNDLDVFIQLFENKFVTRIKKDGVTERFAPDSNSFSSKLTNGRYSISFKLVRPDTPKFK